MFVHSLATCNQLADTLSAISSNHVIKPFLNPLYMYAVRNIVDKVYGFSILSVKMQDYRILGI